MFNLDRLEAHIGLKLAVCAFSKVEMTVTDGKVTTQKCCSYIYLQLNIPCALTYMKNVINQNYA